MSDGNRYCQACLHEHGPLYNCPHYPPEVRAEIAAADARFRANLADPVWVQRQLDNGVPPVAIVFFRALAGL